MYVLYEAASNYLMAFVMGHEMSHAYGRCVIPQASVVETSGVFDRLVGLQSEGRVLCPNPIYVDELKADRCAFRTVQQLDVGMQRVKSPPHVSAAASATLLEGLSMSRRFAIDSLTYELKLGLQPTMGRRA